MSKAEKPEDVFDIERIRKIIELMEQHDLCEVDLQQGGEKIKLNRGLSAMAHSAALVPVPAVAPALQPTADSPMGPADSAGTITINAPMVGTFYTRADPESEPFVKLGDQVSEETIVCIVEAMKVFNEIPAECRGKIVEVLCNDQAPVDYGKPMFRVQPNA
jgi:acetyl-CoA carboxylase biotin carboxyl carrier protein